MSGFAGFICREGEEGGSSGGPYILERWSSDLEGMLYEATL